MQWWTDVYLNQVSIICLYKQHLIVHEPEEEEGGPEESPAGVVSKRNVVSRRTQS